MPYVENVINHEVEGHVSQYEDEEAKSYVSSDEGKVVDPVYYEEASYGEDDKSGYLSQEDDSDDTCPSSYESDANWEEERNENSEYSYASKDMSSCSKSENEVPSQNCTNHLEVETCKEDLSTQYEDNEIIYKDELRSCVYEYHKVACSSNQ